MRDALEAAMANIPANHHIVGLKGAVAERILHVVSHGEAL